MTAAGRGGHTALHHAHLWLLPDGTGLHAPYAELVVDDNTARLCCHLCGRWFRALGSHVRVHGHTADTYRETMGLCTTAALTSADVSTALAARASHRYATDEHLRAELAAGRRLLQPKLGRNASSPDVAEPAQRRAVRQRTLSAGRMTMTARRARELDTRLAELGFSELHAYLRTAYAAGASLASLARNTGLGRAALRTQLNAAGVTVRPTGRTTPDGRRSRAIRAELDAAARVGTHDLVAWLTERHDRGATLAQLARETGRSYHWVRWRLETAAARSA